MIQILKQDEMNILFFWFKTKIFSCLFINTIERIKRKDF